MELINSLVSEVPVFPPVAKPCSDGEEWKTCVSGSCAETTCERRVLPNACTEDCNYGCYCSDGGTRPFPRPKHCPRNEVYRACVSSSCAEATCQKPTVGPACTADCRSGCFCEDGFFRNDAQLCVERDQCP
ncbi:cysteine rich secreted protein, putative [Ixodes scapularis]|uniref:Cysteine rich secreted protein, putative n=1 Tax=Ixodes scapularis TaxID=6945 RepID=B7QA02_IXOSC|nr:cysteine rich secreted protein, putative [Ixodes scapularis]|eukprot:XP_002399664.1 cysteine rich secreted protein, putative [Ixodes scapularis]